MIIEILLRLAKNPWTWVILLIVGLSIFGYIQYTQVQELKFEKTVLTQNELALRDSLTKTKDSIQTTVSYVRDLNDKYTKLQKKYIILQANYSTAIDTIKILKEGIAQMKNDSVAVIPLNGKQGIASYNGQTEFNILSKRYRTTLDLAFDDILGASEVFLDKTDELWKIRMYSKTPGVKVIGYSTIDENTLREIKGVEKPCPPQYYFAVGGLLSKNQIYGGVMLKPSNWMVGLNYKIFDKNKLPNEDWASKLLITLHYYLF